MNKDSFAATKCLNKEACEEFGNGAFCFTSDFSYIGILVCGSFEYIRIYTQGAPRPTNERHSWLWNGNKEKPTLHPSINKDGIWHGFLTDGHFKSV